MAGLLKSLFFAALVLSAWPKMKIEANSSCVDLPRAAFAESSDHAHVGTHEASQDLDCDFSNAHDPNEPAHAHHHAHACCTNVVDAMMQSVHSISPDLALIRFWLAEERHLPAPKASSLLRPPAVS